MSLNASKTIDSSHPRLRGWSAWWTFDSSEEVRNDKIKDSQSQHPIHTGQVKTCFNNCQPPTIWQFLKLLLAECDPIKIIIFFIFLWDVLRYHRKLFAWHSYVPSRDEVCNVTVFCCNENGSMPCDILDALRASVSINGHFDSIGDNLWIYKPRRSSKRGWNNTNTRSELTPPVLPSFRWS